MQDQEVCAYVRSVSSRKMYRCVDDTSTYACSFQAQNTNRENRFELSVSLAPARPWGRCYLASEEKWPANISDSEKAKLPSPFQTLQEPSRLQILTLTCRELNLQGVPEEAGGGVYGLRQFCLRRLAAPSATDLSP